MLHFVHFNTDLRLLRQSRTSYLAVLSKLKPAAGVWWIFDSAILDPSAPAVRRCAWGRRWLRRPPSSFRFHSEKMETRGAYSAVNGVSTGVSPCHFNGYIKPTNTIKRKIDRRALLRNRSWVRDVVFAECCARSETTSCAIASPLTLDFVLLLIRTFLEWHKSVTAEVSRSRISTSSPTWTCLPPTDHHPGSHLWRRGRDWIGLQGFYWRVGDAAEDHT